MSRILLVALGCLGPSFADAVDTSDDAPLIINSPETPGPGGIEMAGTVTTTRADGETAYDAPTVSVKYGIGQCVQLKAEVGLEHSDGRTSLSTTEVGVKWRFADQSDAIPVDASIYPQVEIAPPPALDAEERTEHSIVCPVQIRHRLGDCALMAEGGASWSLHDSPELLYGSAVQWSFATTIIGVELSGRRRTEKERPVVLTNLGIRESVIDDLGLLLAVGRRVTHAGPAFAMTVGIEYSR